MPRTLPARSEVDPATTWDLSGLFPSPAAWEATCVEVEAQLREVYAFTGRLGSSPDVLVDFLRLQDGIRNALGRILLYTLLETSADSSDDAASARADAGQALAARADAAIAFAEPELIDVGFSTLRSWIATDSRLADRGRWLDRLERRAPHVRPPEVERVLAASLDPLRTMRVAHAALGDLELPFPAVRDSHGQAYELAPSSYPELQHSSDRTLRENSFVAFSDTYLAFRRTLAALLTGGVKRDVFLARARGYESALDAAVLSVDVPPQVPRAVVDSLRDHVGVWHRYWRLRRRALHLDVLRDFDTRAVLAQDVPVPYDQAVEWLAQGLAPLGRDYVDRMRRGATTERWVDIYPNRGKRLGAFSYGPPGTHPYVFMSYYDSLASLSTLAHELGHGLHYQRAAERQPYHYSGCGMFIAEVASNTNQALVRRFLLNQHPHDVRLQIGVLEEAIGNFHRYLFVMPTLTRLEIELHDRVWRGESMTPDDLLDLTADLIGEVYGDEVAMDRRRAGTLWAQFHTHLYTAFHPFNYTTGIAAAQVIAQAIMEEGQPAVDRYDAFLAAGSSVDPLDAVSLAGVDLSTRAPIDHAYDVLEGYIARLEKLIA